MNIDFKFEESKILKNNALLKKRPELFSEWDFEKNDELGLDIYKISYGSANKPWWNCLDCKSKYDMSPNNRTNLNQNCPYCAGKRVNHTNSFSLLYPELALEWHPELNGVLTPANVTSKSHKKVWWLGQCGHEWNSAIGSRTGMNANCPYCTNQKVLIGFNDMWTTNPELASQLLRSVDGYKYTQSSEQKVNWKCITCDNNIENKRISDTNARGVACPRCSDGIHFPEKIMYALLKEKGIEFVYNETQKWSKKFRYDFYLPKYNWIIETHGIQHYGEGFEAMGGRTLLEEKENDRIKEDLAYSNGISSYVVIDSRESTISHISKSVNESILIEIVGEDIDFIKIGKKASKSMIKVACDLWNSGISSTKGIAEEMGLSTTTIGRYLKRGVEIGWCDYCPKKAMKENGNSAAKLRRRSVIQLNENLEFVCEWESATEAGKTLKIHRGNIPKACSGKGHKVGGFRWMYKEDHEKMIKEGSSYEEYMHKYYSKAKNKAS